MDNTKTEEMISSLCTADTLVESEYLQTLRRTEYMEPEKSLMLGVLKDAIDCFLDNVNTSNRKRQRHFQEAEEWIFQEATDWTFSFESICGILGLEPGYIRKGLRQHEREKLIQSAPAAEPLPYSTRGAMPCKTSGTLSKRFDSDPCISLSAGSLPAKDGVLSLDHLVSEGGMNINHSCCCRDPTQG